MECGQNMTKLPLRVAGQTWPPNFILEYKTFIEIDKNKEWEKQHFFVDGVCAVGGQDTD